MDIHAIEANAEAVLAQLKTVIAPLEAAAPILAAFLPAPEKAALLGTIAMIKAFETAAPDFSKNVQAVLADIKAVITAMENAKNGVTSAVPAA